MQPFERYLIAAQGGDGGRGPYFLSRGARRSARTLIVAA